MKYVITGGAGFVGSCILNKLRQQGHDVYSIDRDIHEKYIEDRNYIWADICNEEYFNKILNVVYGADAVIHLAAKKSVINSVEHIINYNRVNVSGSLNMLEICREAGVNRFVFASSAAVYGESSRSLNTGIYGELDPVLPISPYGLQKLTVEKYCELYSKLHNIDTVSLRYFNVFGSGSKGSVIDIFLEQHRNGKPLTIRGSGEQSRDFVHVDDIADATIAAAQRPDDFMGDVLNVGSGVAHSVRDIATAITGKEVKIPKTTKYSSSPEALTVRAKIKRIKRELAWEPKVKVLEWIKKEVANI